MLYHCKLELHLLIKLSNNEFKQQGLLLGKSLCVGKVSRLSPLCSAPLSTGFTGQYTKEQALKHYKSVSYLTPQG